MAWLWIIPAVIAFIAIVLICGALYFFNLAVVRADSDAYEHPTTKGMMKYWDPYMPSINANEEWFYAAAPEQVSITSYDGLRLFGRYLKNPGSDKTVLFVHGYRSKGATFDFGLEIRACFDKGFNIFVIDQRAHGKSEGKYICFGVKERCDARDWINYINKTYAPRTLFLYGLSMGCSTVLMASGFTLPGNVRGIIADCGFTSARAQFSYLLKRNYHLPLFPLLQMTNLISKARADFDFKSYSTLDALKTNRIPVLFIHGSKDTFVPTRMGKENYEACIAEKEIVIVEGARHRLAYKFDTVKCDAALSAFLKKYTQDDSATSDLAAKN